MTTNLPKILLLILDGYGLSKIKKGNAAILANTPTLHSLLSEENIARLDASGLSVGLPKGYIGNSEVGHLNIGAGRIIYQDMPRINNAISDGSFFENPVLKKLFQGAREHSGRIHFCGLLSDGGVHSHIDHIDALLTFAEREGVPALVHAFLDGRDTPPTSGKEYLNQLDRSLKKHHAKLADMMGRFYAMDRDKHWERIQTAWEAMICGKAKKAENYLQAITEAYENKETDEFVQPVLFGEPQETTIRDGDAIFFFNFRADRGREFVHALTDTNFAGFDRGRIPVFSGIATMTSYDSSLSVPVAFEKENISETLGETISKNSLSQLRIAETEKYAHVTYFFNGGREEPFPLEDRILVNSPRDVATYDLKPEMSAGEVTDKLIEAWNSKKYTFIVCNLANPDMVGHTGKLDAAIKALETVDSCVNRIKEAVLKTENTIFCITADHGNSEKMLEDDGTPHTAHTLNKTPLLILRNGKPIALNDGKLGDIAPTLLSLSGINIPKEMKGSILIQ